MRPRLGVFLRLGRLAGAPQQQVHAGGAGAGPDRRDLIGDLVRRVALGLGELLEQPVQRLLPRLLGIGRALRLFGGLRQRGGRSEQEQREDQASHDLHDGAEAPV